MRPPRLTLRLAMVLIFLAAIWSYIVVQGLAYQQRHTGPDRMWGQP